MNQRDIRNRLGWEENQMRSRNRMRGTRHVVKAIIPVTIFKRRFNAILCTSNQFSKVNRVTANEAITRGAISWKRKYNFNDVVKGMDVIKIPVATKTGAIQYIECLVDKDIPSNTIELGLPAMEKLKCLIMVGGTRAVHKTFSRNNATVRERSVDHNRNANRSGHSSTQRVDRRRSPQRRTQSSNSRMEDDFLEPISREEMEEIENW